MKKLSKNQTSKKYLDNKFGKSKPLSEEMKLKLEEANKSANEKISRNNSVYKSSNNRSHLYPNLSNSVFETDFSQVDEDINVWHLEREKKRNIYRAFSEYIECLENQLKNVTNPYQKYLLESEIKKLRIEQKQYYVPSILEMARFDLISSDEELSGNSLEIAATTVFKKLKKL